MADQLGRSVASCGQSGRYNLFWFKSESFAALSLAVVYGPSQKEPSQTLYSQFTVDAQGQCRHLQVKRPL